MNMSGTVGVIKDIIASVKREPQLAATLADDADIVNGVRLDSLELLQFMLEVEERLAIRIDFDALEFTALHSIRGLAEFLDTMPRREGATKAA
jgi:acyl carrier protein